MRLDHLAVSAMTLEEGVAHVEAALGVALAPGGQHPLMATHNRRRGLGDVYLEVIAADPAPGGMHRLSAEVARQLALWMCYEDVVRVAQLKSSAARFAAFCVWRSFRSATTAFRAARTASHCGSSVSR
jgi:hypothetical protein